MNLPIPKRFVIELSMNIIIHLWADEEVAEFLRTLVAVESVTYHETLKRYIVDFDKRYSYNKETLHQTFQWVAGQLENEFGKTKPPKKENME